MTRASWPLSRDAVEAAIMDLYRRRGEQHFSDGRWQPIPLDPSYRARLESEVLAILRAALAAWVPSEGQLKAADEAYEPSQEYGLDTDDTRAVILAAVRTEAAE